MKLRLAKSAGFCHGVRRAVELAERAAEGPDPVVMLGHIIHNDFVVGALEARGVKLAQRLEDIPPGAAVILRSHGEGAQVHRALAEAGNPILDATCPHVSAIHRIVAQAGEAGREVVIFGKPDHPEVLATAGWCRGATVVESSIEFAAWLNGAPERRGSPLTLVAQTTAMRTDWDMCVKIAKKECTNAKVFDTICFATGKRQAEARDLASSCDTMVVIGDEKSSNTRKLAELCRATCPRTFCVRSAQELDLKELRGADCIGITAGASTPGWIIKEVYDKMSDEIMEIEESFAELLEKSIKTLHTGEKVKGVVTQVTPTEVQVDLGTKHACYISMDEFTDDPSAKLEDLVHVGEEIEAFVVRVNDQEGVANLSKKRLDSIKSWEDIEAACEARTIVEGIVTEENKGGVVVSIRGVRVFVPASQTGLPREAEMSELLKKKVVLRIREINRARRRVVGSIRDAEQESRAEKAAEVWNGIEVGKRYSGVVKSLTSYGAFVDIGGVDGMVHVSELSWSRVKHPSEVVKPGDAAEVYVISFDAEKKKISLGMKDRGENPWEKFLATCKIGDTVDVRVVKLMAFGAFAEIVPGVDGLIHISQIADRRIDKPGDALAEGQQIQVRITDIDLERKKVSLSRRALLEDKQTAADEAAMGAEDALVAVSEGGVTAIASAFDEPAAEDTATPEEAPAAE